MLAAIGTLMVDTFATSFYKNTHFDKAKKVNDADEEAVDGDEHAGHVHVHTHSTHGHAHGASVPSHDDMSISDLVRHRIISQVLELGIIVHSIIIGISLGASQSLDTIKPLLVALSFHQFFEGMGLGGCISQGVLANRPDREPLEKKPVKARLELEIDQHEQARLVFELESITFIAKFKSCTTTVMMLFFSLTTPIGIGAGIGISTIYKENSPKALIFEGILDSASAGILIYMSLVDLLAADFMNPRMQSNVRLQLGAHTSLLLGAGCMSLLAKWA
ncbi:hypothetical protein OROGR_003427 [Orobanche gracilis]